MILEDGVSKNKMQSIKMVGLIDAITKQYKDKGKLKKKKKKKNE